MKPAKAPSDNGSGLRILYAEDHALVREAMIPYLVNLRAGTRVVEAASANEALSLAHDADLVLLDLQMPGMNGFAGFDRLREAIPHTPIVILSGFSDKRTIQAALERGAAGFVPKSAGHKTLVRALEAVLDGERFIPSQALEQSDAPSIFDVSTSPVLTAESPLMNLTEREIAVLRQLAAGQCNKEIAVNLAIHPITVKVHLRNCYRKMGAKNRADAVRMTYEWGLPGAAA